MESSTSHRFLRIKQKFPDGNKLKNKRVFVNSLNQKEKRDKKFNLNRPGINQEIEDFPSLESKSDKGSMTLKEKQEALKSRLEEYKWKKKLQKNSEKVGKKPIFRVGGHLTHRSDSLKKLHEEFESLKKNKVVVAKRTFHENTKTLEKKAQYSKETDKNLTINPESESSKSLEQEQVESNDVGVLASYEESEDKASYEQNEKSEEFCEDTVNLETRSVPPNRSPRTNTPNETNESEIFKTPRIPPLSSTKSSQQRRRRRISKISPLLDSLRHDIDFERGSHSDRVRRKKGLAPSLTSPHDELLGFFKNDKLTFPPRILYFETERTLQDFKDLLDSAKKQLDSWIKTVCSSKNKRGKQEERLVAEALALYNEKGQLNDFEKLCDSTENGSDGLDSSAYEDLQRCWNSLEESINNLKSQFSKVINTESKENTYNHHNQSDYSCGEKGGDEEEETEKVKKIENTPKVYLNPISSPSSRSSSSIILNNQDNSSALSSPVDLMSFETPELNKTPLRRSGRLSQYKGTKTSLLLL